MNGHTAMRRGAWRLVPGVPLAGCATPVRYRERPLTRYDKATEHGVDDRPGGFTVSVEYARYQFIPETWPVVSRT